MADWVSGAKLQPGGKVYLLCGTAANAVDVLIGRATAGITHRHHLEPPFTRDDLGVTLGTPEESQVTIIRAVETATEAEWALLTAYLQPDRVPGSTLLLTGTGVGDSGTARALRAKIGRSKWVAIDVADPTGLVGRRRLEQWVAEEWQTTTLAAVHACRRAGYSIETLVHATRAFRALTSGRPVEGYQALALVELAVAVPATEQAYRLVLARHRDAVTAVHGFTPTQAVRLFHLLEAALTDIELIYPVLISGHSPTSVADKTGLHLIRALELSEWAPRYPPDVAFRCRQMLALGLTYIRQPEVASTVVMLWR